MAMCSHAYPGHYPLHPYYGGYYPGDILGEFYNIQR